MTGGAALGVGREGGGGAEKGHPYYNTILTELLMELKIIIIL